MTYTVSSGTLNPTQLNSAVYITNYLTHNPTKYLTAFNEYVSRVRHK